MTCGPDSGLGPAGLARVGLGQRSSPFQQATRPERPGPSLPVTKNRRIAKKSRPRPSARHACGPALTGARAGAGAALAIVNADGVETAGLRGAAAPKRILFDCSGNPALAAAAVVMVVATAAESADGDGGVMQTAGAGRVRAGAVCAVSE
jgi:hypothetical protein